MHSKFTHLIILLLLKSTLEAPPTKIPVGILLSYDSEQEASGIRFAITQNRNNTLIPDFTQLDTDMVYIDIGSSYAMTDRMCRQMKQGTFAVVGSLSKLGLHCIDSWTRKYEMPYITPSPAMDLSPDPFIIQMQPEYTEAVIEYLMLHNVRKVYYIYDGHIGITHLQKLYAIITTKKLPLTVRPRYLATISDGHEFLRQIDVLEQGSMRNETVSVTVIMDFIDTFKLRLLLQQTVEVGMNRLNYRYLLYTLGIEELDLDVFVHGGANITGFQLVDHKSPLAQSFVKDWKTVDPDIWMGAGEKIPYKAALAADIMRVFAEAIISLTNQDESLFNDAFRRGQLYNKYKGRSYAGIPCEIDPIPWEHGRRIRDAMLNIQTTGLTGPISFDESGQRTNFKLQIKQISLNKKLSAVGEWNNNELRIFGNEFNQSLSGVMNITYFRVVSIISPPFLTVGI